MRTTGTIFLNGDRNLAPQSNSYAKWEGNDAFGDSKTQGLYYHGDHSFMRYERRTGFGCMEVTRRNVSFETKKSILLLLASVFSSGGHKYLSETRMGWLFRDENSGKVPGHSTKILEIRV